MCISVVIPTCDREDKLRLALDSVFKQSYKDVETFVVDNGRTAICRSFAEAYPLATFLRIPPRSGVAVARNWGAMHAQGTYLAFLDDDDVWPSDYLRTMLGHLESTEHGLVAAPNCDLATGKIIAMPIPIPSDRRLEQWRELAYMGSNMLMRRDAFNAVGGFSARLVTGEDRALVIRLHLAGVRIGRCVDTYVLRNMDPCDRLTSVSNLLLGKLSFLSEFREEMPRRDRNDDQLAFLIYLSKAWGWPVWPMGALCVPGSAFRRTVKFTKDRIRRTIATWSRRK